MNAKIWIAAVFALVGAAPLAQAQDWDDRRDRRMEFMHRLGEACDRGDDRACGRLEHMRREMRERHEWREHDEDRRW